MVVDEAGPSPRGLCGLSLSHNMAAEAADTSVEAAPSPRSLPSPPRPGSSRRRFFTAEHSTRSSVGAYDPLPGEGESVAVALSVSPSEGENCIAAEREDVVPPVRCIFGGQLGPRLSSPEGAPTAYSYVIYGLLGGETVVMLFFGYDGRGILNKLGCERTSGCSSNDAVAAAEMALHLGAVALFAAGAFVFHSLRCVTRTAEAGGQLALLGVGTTQISASVARSLQRWRYLVRTMIWPLAMANLGQAALVALNPKYETAHRLFYFLMFFGCAMVSVTLGEWWLTLRLAVELTDHKTKPVVNAAKAAAEREVELDDAAWWFTIEEPAQKLAQETLPLLSDGWGPSLVAAMVGIGAIALGGFLHLSETPQHVWDDSGLVHRMMAGTVAFIASLPVLLALAPARISTACDELTDSLTDLHTKGDPVRQYERMVPLETILDRANRKNGIGFRIGRGTVLDKKALLLTAVKVYSLVATAVPLLLSALEMVPDDDPMCHHGWSRIDENCIKVFRTEPQTWPAAESVCGGYGGHLASIGSRTEHDAVLALMQSAAIGLAWIGLTDVVEESAFVWSDGAPHEYSQWAVRQPDERNEAGQCTTGNDCAAISSRGWEDYPCEVTGLPDKPGCYPHQLPFVCAKPALPGTVAVISPCKRLHAQPHSQPMRSWLLSCLCA